MEERWGFAGRAGSASPKFKRYLSKVVKRAKARGIERGDLCLDCLLYVPVLELVHVFGFVGREKFE